VNRVGRYEITERLGQGGMGTVYKAFDPLLTRVVAVKVISAQLDSQPEQRERFFREARAAAQLSHRNIVTIFDLGEQDGVPFLAMQYLEGRDLEQRMREAEGMLLSRKLEVALMVCEGLAHAHACGVIHRDVKPANIFLTDDGQAKILDFGLARLVTSELTRSNMMVGTVNYMAPEQLRGEKSDHRADIFSFGVVLYELICGKKPFQADSFASTMYKILNEMPEALDHIDPTLPPSLTAIVDRAIAKAREDRYPHMTDLLRDLEVAYEPLRGSDRRVISQLDAVLRPASGSRSQSRPIDQLSSPDAVTMASPVPSVVRPGSGGMPVLPPAAGTSSPQPQLSPVSLLPAPAATSRRWVYATVFGIAMAGLSVFVLRDRSQPPAAVETRSPSTPVPPAGPPRPTVPVPETPERPELPERREAPERPEAAERPEPPDPDPNHAAPALPSSRTDDSSDAASRTASEIAARVARANRQGRASFQAGRYDEAARRAAEALALDRSNKEANELVARITAVERGHAATAMAAMDAAKAAATEADARTLVPALFSAAEKQEALARAAHSRQQFTSAAARMEAATTLFKTAEAGARTEVEARAARAQAAEVARHRAEAAPKPEPPPAPLPSPPPKPEAPPPPSPAVSAQATRAAVTATLERYTAAMEQRDLGALKAIWPGLGGAQQVAIEKDFENARSISVQFVDPKIEVTGSTATVTGLRRYGLHTRDGQQLRSETTTTLVLRQAGNGWHIESVRYRAR
jgi:serine/threonine protein kinase/tetratricopeptide (TPR) repeat protein